VKHAQADINYQLPREGDNHNNQTLKNKELSETHNNELTKRLDDCLTAINQVIS